MTEQQHTPEETPEQPQAATAPSPAPVAPEDKKDTDGGDTKKDDAPPGVPASQILLGGASTTALSGFWIASTWGPWAAAGVGATAVATGGAAYVAHRRRKKGQAGMRRETTTVRKSSGGTSSLGKTAGLGGRKSAGGGSESGGSRGKTSGAATRAGGAGKSAAQESGSPGKRQGGASSPAGGASGRGSSPRGSGGASPAGKSGRPAARPGGSSKGPGGSSRGSGKGGGPLNPFSRKNSGRGSGGSGGPSSGGRGGSSGRRSWRKHSTPPGDGGMPGSTAAPKSRTKSGRWGRSGGTSGSSTGDSTKKKGGGPMGSSSRGASGGRGSTTPGRFARAAGRAGRWFDGKTGQRASTAWKAASGARGFRARRQAARHALRSKSGRPAVNGTFAVLGAILAGLFAWGGSARAAWRRRAEAAMDSVDPNARAGGEQEHEHHARSGAAAPSASDTTPKTERAGATENASTPTPGATTSNTTVPTGGNAMALPHAQIAADMVSAASRYEPDDAFRAVDESREWMDVSANVALSVRTYVQRLEGAQFPLTRDAYDALQRYYTALSQTISIAEEIHPLLRKAHEIDMARRDAPRGNESKWNV